MYLIVLFLLFGALAFNWKQRDDCRKLAAFCELLVTEAEAYDDAVLAWHTEQLRLEEYRRIIAEQTADSPPA